MTLNATDRIDPASVVATMQYRHPLYDLAAVRAQRRLGEITTERTAFAGAYHGLGLPRGRLPLGGRGRRGLRGHLVSTVADLPTLPALVVGQVHHTRHRPLRHSFTHRHYQWLVDLDAMPRAAPLAAPGRRVPGRGPPGRRTRHPGPEGERAAGAAPRGRRDRRRRARRHARPGPGARAHLRPDDRLLVLRRRRHPARRARRGAQHLRRPARLRAATPTTSGGRAPTRSSTSRRSTTSRAATPSAST